MSAMPARDTMSIGEVLARLRSDFPDVSISKIRFLESEGLIEPQRAPSGYRRFTHDDVSRLRYVLSVQRDHYLPLRVIKRHLDALDRGLEQPLVGPALRQAAPAVDGRSMTESGDHRDARLTRADVVDAAGVGEDFFDQLVAYGIVTTRDGSSYYDRTALLITKIAAELASHGVEPRHLRAVRTAADRQVGLVEQVVAPLRRQRVPEAGGRAEDMAREIAALSTRLHALLVEVGLRRR